LSYAQAATGSFAPESVAPPPEGFSDIPYQAGQVGAPFRLRVAAGTGTYADVKTAAGARGAGPARARLPLKVVDAAVRPLLHL
jgi:hypothetical protein